MEPIPPSRPSSAEKFPKSLHIELTSEPIDAQRLLDRVADPDCGAQLLFLGSTRRTTGDRITERLTYQAYASMARGMLAELATEAAGRWPLWHVAIEHRIDDVPVGQTSVAVAAASPHRVAVMEAVPWIMDALKQRVPIWKKETFADGSRQWIHP